MDNGYAGLVDQAMLQSATSYTPYDTLLKPAGGSMQLSGLYDPNARIKCEEGLSDIFSRAAAQLYQKALKFPELSFGSATTCDLRAIRAPTPSCVPMFEAMDFIASANSFSFLGSSECMPSLHTSVSSTEETTEKHIRHEVEEFTLAGHTVSSSSFSGGVMHSRELFRDASPTLPATSLPSSTPTLPESSTAGMAASLHARPVAPSDVSDMVGSIPDSANSPIKQDSPGQSAEDSDADPKSHNSKRRKTQQKRVVCVPIGGESKQKGEAPPSDLWAWRKYGQKPIKGSPYPRGYYRCSSSKGCSARKQVERSRSDPTMLVVTYTSDHNHPWPANRSSSAASSSRPSPKISNAQAGQEEGASCEISGNLFSSIINSPNAVDEQVMPSLDTLQNEESFSLQRDVDLCLSRTTTEEDDVFDDLEELPELSAIFSKGFLEDSLNEEVTNSMDSCNPCSISNWASMALMNKSGIR